MSDGMETKISTGTFYVVVAAVRLMAESRCSSGCPVCRKSDQDEGRDRHQSEAGLGALRSRLRRHDEDVIQDALGRRT